MPESCWGSETRHFPAVDAVGFSSKIFTMKFAFVSSGLPPSWSGQSVVIYRLLKDFSAEDYCLITQDYGQGSGHREKKEGRLRGKYFYIPRRYSIPVAWRYGLVRWANIQMRAKHIAAIVKREKCEAIVACPGDYFDLPAALYASRLTGARFYPYMLDYYSQQSNGFKSEVEARRFEAEMMEAATGVIVPNEFMGDELRRRYGVTELTIVRNPCDLDGYRASSPETSEGEPGSIVYTGSIYNAHFEAFRNLLQAIKALGRPDVKLQVYTNQSEEELTKNGISGPIILHKSESASAVPAIQRQADLLFLPLAFDSPFPELIRTSAPGKTGEYLASRRPVLVHAPPDSFVSWYFRHHDCGVVVDDNNPEKLAEALNLILSDRQLRDRITTNAWQRANSDFSVEASQAAFAKLMELNSFSLEG